MPVATIETNNVLQLLEGPQYVLQVGEGTVADIPLSNSTLHLSELCLGTYVLRDDLQLATPPPHPSEAPIQNPNPLATNPTPPTSGVKLSLTIIKPRKFVPQLYNLPTTRNGSSDRITYSIKESEKESRPSAELGSDAGAQALSIESGNASNSAPAFGEGNVALSPNPSKEALKRRKPKNNIIKSNSSFVSRVIPHDSLAKRLSDRDSGGVYAFANINRAFQWLDLSSNIKAEAMAKVLFTKAHMLCHDVNTATKGPSHIDIIMGSSAGDIIWYEPMSQKYARINKNGAINNTPVSHIKWIPGSENLFLASHTDGTLVVYDKEKDDSSFFAEEALHDEEAVSSGDEESTVLEVTKSVNSTNQKLNPVACWKISRQTINQFAFSPDCRHLAVVSEDGYLRIIDYLQERCSASTILTRTPRLTCCRLTDVYSSYYGGFICVCWSPDGKYVLTGGQDDLVSIWSLPERQIVARCQGHHSWVTAVAFDPWRCDDRNYRFGSVGDDCKLLLWDFSVGMLHRPRGVSDLFTLLEVDWHMTVNLVCSDCNHLD